MLEAALAVPNVRRFVRFRIFFNARYYYPVFTILFLDFGISLEAFALLNVLWAITIVLAEVPSGALADVIGRRRLLVAGGALMCLEMLVLLCAPVGGGALTLTLFAINRIASGLAEAMVSGADEALAYDSMKAEGVEHAWPEVLEHTGKRLALTMAAVMVTGALVYDADLLNLGLAALPGGWQASPTLLHRLPVALTLLHAIYVLGLALRMREPASEDTAPDGQALSPRLRASFTQIGHAAAWLLSNRFILFVILGGLILDSTARHFIILNSEYYRMLRIPEFAYGFISAGLAAVGYVTAMFSRYLARHHSPLRNLLILSGLLLFGLAGVSRVVPYAGVLFVPFITLMFGAVSFLQSHYINRDVGSRQRATVLSFRGLATNLGLGVASLLYTLLIGWLKRQDAGAGGEAREDAIFVQALAWFPGYYAVLLALVLTAGHVLIRRRHLYRQPVP